jgi:predicted PurR-regulated permease PerM
MQPNRSILILLLLCTLILVFAALHYASAIIAPAAFALFVIAIVWPLQSALQARIPKLLALVVTILVTLSAIAVLVYLFIWAFGVVGKWLIGNADRFQSLYAEAIDWLDDHGVPVTSLIAEKYSPGWIVGAVREAAGRGYRLVSFVVLAFAFIALALLEVDIVRRNLEHLGDSKYQQSLLTAGREIAAKFQKYMLVRSAMSALTGIAVWGFALVAGIELATAWGVIAFVLNYIPFIGALLATILPTIFALAQSESWQVAIVVFACLSVIQFFIGSYLEPRIAGAALSMSPFVVLFSVCYWSFLWGIAGAFIGVPIMIAVLTICEQHPSTRWFAVLLSGRERKPA